MEIGAGTGANFACIPAGVDWTGIDPNPHSLRYVREAALRSGHKFDLHQAFAESLPFPDASFDSVASTLTLCSVRDPVLVLDEIRRVLRPGGRALVYDLHAHAARLETEHAGLAAADAVFGTVERTRHRGVGPLTIVWRADLRA